MIKSYNNIIITEPYKGKTGIRSKVQSGVAVIQQKVNVVPLRVLQDAYISDKIEIKKGDVVYVKEDILHVNKQYSQPLECDDVSGQFVLMNYSHIAFVKKGK